MSDDHSEVYDDLRTRIAAVLYERSVRRAGLDFKWATLTQNVVKQSWLDDADAVIRELTDAILSIVASAIQGWAQSELAAMSYHGASKDAFDLMEALNREAMQIAQYATTHKDWNG